MSIESMQHREFDIGRVISATEALSPASKAWSRRQNSGASHIATTSSR